MKKTKQKLVNHVAFVVDASGSMGHLTNKVREVLATQYKNLQAQAKSTGQDTLLSLFYFGTSTKRAALEIDITRVDPGAFTYNADLGNTALIDATFEAINSIERAVDLKDGDDHSFLLYVITDGAENASARSGSDLRKRLDRLSDDWTVGVMVPNSMGAHLAKTYGFPSGNVEIWDASSEQGLEEAGQKISYSTQSYYSLRSSGLKSTKSLFTPTEPTKTEVKRKLDEVDPGEYETLLVRKHDDGRAIKDFVESLTQRPYRVGSAYYQLTKPEVIQPGKNLAVVEKSTGKMYSGLNARSALGIPTYEIKASPADFQLFDIFIQSTSTNRKLVKDTHLLVFK